MKYNRIFALFCLVSLIFSKPNQAATVYNRVSSNHSINHNNHSHPAAEVRKCNPPEEGQEVLNGNRSSQMFLPVGRRNIHFGKSSKIIYERQVAPVACHPYITSNNTHHLPVLSMLILFPFHSFW